MQHLPEPSPVASTRFHAVAASSRIDANTSILHAAASILSPPSPAVTPTTVLVGSATTSPGPPPFLLLHRRRPQEEEGGLEAIAGWRRHCWILCFDVANAMSRAVNLYRSFFDSEITRLRSQTLASPAVRLLVSTNESYLLVLALVEKLDDLNRVATVASRLGHRCSHPALLGFEHVYSDLLASRIGPADHSSISRRSDPILYDR